MFFDRYLSTDANVTYSYKPEKENYKLSLHKDQFNINLNLETSYDATLKANLSSLRPSKVTYDSPATKANFELDALSPVKTLKADYDNVIAFNKFDAEINPGKSFRYDFERKNKDVENREYDVKVNVNGVPGQELMGSLNNTLIRMELSQPADDDKATFTYIIGAGEEKYVDVTEYQFDPDKSYPENLSRALAKFSEKPLMAALI